MLFGDVFGAALALVFLAGMALLPPDGKRFYASLGLVVAYLELVGTALGAWTWAPVSLGLAAANPPSGAVGGYSLVDGSAVPCSRGADLRRRPGGPPAPGARE